MGTHRFHVLAVIGLVVVELTLPFSWMGYYKLVRRPSLLARGAQNVAQYQPVIRDEMPEDADIVVLESLNGVTTETYFGRSGNLVTTVRSRDGRWFATEGHFQLTKALFALPLLGLAVLILANLHKMARTRVLFNWQLGRYPNDRFETILYIYGFPLFVSGIAAMAIHTIVLG